MAIRGPFHHLLVPLVATVALTACAGSYTGPVEVTRFVADDRATLGQGRIRIEFPDEIRNKAARDAFTAAIAQSLTSLGYEVVLDFNPAVSDPATQIAAVRTSRSALAGESSRGPVSVGVGGQTGSFGSGVGVGVGVDLGGGTRGPNVLSELAVRISTMDGVSLWEGRAQQPVSINSPYSEVATSANTLAAALFRDFPGGNGETVSVNVSELSSAR